MNKKLLIVLCFVVIVASVCFISCSACAKSSKKWQNTRASFEYQEEEICRSYSQIENFIASYTTITIYIDQRYIDATDETETAAFVLRFCQQIRQAALDTGIFEYNGGNIMVFIYNNETKELLRTLTINEKEGNEEQ